MSTRAIITFTDSTESIHVFQHFDGYPTGIQESLARWQDSGLSWAFPRFEADEAAAGFVAANKTQAGGFRIARTRTAFCDVEYGYRVKSGKDGILLTVSATNFWDGKRKESVLWRGPIAEYTADVALKIEESDQ